MNKFQLSSLPQLPEAPQIHSFTEVSIQPTVTGSLYMPGIFLGAEVTEVNKSNKVLNVCNLYSIS